jgi:hypothetical protein
MPPPFMGRRKLDKQIYPKLCIPYIHFYSHEPVYNNSYIVREERASQKINEIFIESKETIFRVSQQTEK